MLYYFWSWFMDTKQEMARILSFYSLWLSLTRTWSSWNFENALLYFGNPDIFTNPFPLLDSIFKICSFTSSSKGTDTEELIAVTI